MESFQLLDAGAFSNKTQNFTIFLYERIKELQEAQFSNSKPLLSTRMPTFEKLIIILYALIIIIGGMSNILVVLVIILSKQTITVTNLYVNSLSVSDLVLCLFSLPIQVHYQITENWIFGESMCRISMWVMAIPMFVSTNIIFLIAYDRYVLVVHPFKKRLGIKNCSFCIFGNVLISMFVSFPVIYFTNSQKFSFGSNEKVHCFENWTIGQIYRKAYAIIVFVFLFCLPLFITIIMYFQVYKYLNKRTIKFQNNFVLNNVEKNKNGDCKNVLAKTNSLYLPKTKDVFKTVSFKEFNDLEKKKNTHNILLKKYSKKTPQMCSTYLHPSIASMRIRQRFNKTNRILIATVINFFICRFPWNLYGLIFELKADYSSTTDTMVSLTNIFNPSNTTASSSVENRENDTIEDSFGVLLSVLDLSFKWLMMLSVCINPFLYCWLNENLRNEFVDFINRIKSNSVFHRIFKNVPRTK